MSHPSPLDIDSVEEFQGENLRGRLCSICIQFRQAFKLLPEGLADIQFAPIGLVDMYNSGGALEALSCINDSSGCTINAKVWGYSRLGAHSNNNLKKKKKRKSCAVDRKVEEFLDNAQDSLLTFQRQGECKSREVQIVYWIACIIDPRTLHRCTPELALEATWNCHFFTQKGFCVKTNLNKFFFFLMIFLFILFLFYRKSNQYVCCVTWNLACLNKKID